MLSHFHFLRPAFLFLMLPLGILIIAVSKQALKKNQWQQICDPHLLPHLLVRRQQDKKRVGIWLLSTIVCLLVLALAGPSWSLQPRPMFQQYAARVILLDLSPAMLAEDLHPNRLTRAKFKLRDIIQRSHDHLLGLVVFTREPYLVAPLTEDGATLTNQIDVLSPRIMPTDGDNISHALTFASKLITQANQTHGQILLITSATPQSKDYQTAKKIAAKGFEINVLGMATHEGGPIPLSEGNFMQDHNGHILVSRLQAQALTHLATAGGGHYATFSNNDSDLDQLLTHNILTHTPTQQLQLEQNHWSDAGPWFLLITLPLIALGFRRGWLESLLK